MGIFGSSVYTDPSQLADDVSTSAAYTFGAPAMDAKTAIAAQKAQAAAYNPLYSAYLRANNPTPKFDMSGSSNWSEGLAKAMGNLNTTLAYRRRDREDKQMLDQWSNQLAQDKADQASVLQAQQNQVDQNARHIADTYGPEAAFAYQLNPGKYSGKFAEGFGSLPTISESQYLHSYGSGMGQGDAGRDNLTANDRYFRQQYGFDPSQANQLQVSPQFFNSFRNVYGHDPVDLLDFQNRGYESQTKAGEAAVAGYKPAQANADLTKTNLSNSIEAVKAKFALLMAQADADIKNLEIQAKNTNNTKLLQELADKQAFKEQMQSAFQQMGNDSTLTPQDAMKLDQLAKTVGYNTNFVGDIKSIANPKAGQALTPGKVQNATGANGFVHLGSGYYQDPQTGQVFKQGKSGASAGKPKAVISNPAAAAEESKALSYPGATISRANTSPPPFWQLTELLGDWVHNGGANLMPGGSFTRGY